MSTKATIRTYKFLKKYGEDPGVNMVIAGLENMDASLRRVDVSKFDFPKGNKIIDRPLALDMVEALKSSKNGHIPAAEAPPGFGKTRIFYKFAEEVLKAGGSLLFIGCNDASLDGIRNEFGSYMKQAGIPYRPNEIGDCKFGLSENVFFYTAFNLKKLYEEDPKTFDRFLDRMGCLAIDESHRFPEDVDGDLKIFDKIYKHAIKHFLKNKNGRKPCAALTATHSRTDGKDPVGCPYEKLVFRVSMKDSIDHGYNVPIFGIQSLLKVNGTISKSDDQYNIKFAKGGLNKYYNELIKCFLAVYDKVDRTTVVFVSRREHAIELCKRFNKASGLGKKGLHPLLGNTKEEDRIKLIADVKAGRKLGFITCRVGSESINIPSIEVVHMVSRSTSVSKVIQSIGRGTRLYRKGKFIKRGVVVVDYALMKDEIIRNCVGLRKLQMELGDGSVQISDLPDVENGGNLLGAGEKSTGKRVQKKDMSFCLGDLEAWVTEGSEVKAILDYIEWRDDHGGKAPNPKSKDPEEKRIAKYSPKKLGGKYDLSLASKKRLRAEMEKENA